MAIKMYRATQFGIEIPGVGKINPTLITPDEKKQAKIEKSKNFKAGNIVLVTEAKPKLITTAEEANSQPLAPPVPEEPPAKKAAPKKKAPAKKKG